MVRNGAKTAVLLAALGGVMIGVGSMFGRGGAIIGLMLGLALEKLDTDAARVPMDTAPAPASYSILNPLTGRNAGFANLFRSHPPTQERVARLRGHHV